VNDTSPAVTALVLEGYRKMTPAERLSRMNALTVDLRRLIVADVKRRRPNATDADVRAELARRWLPPELAERVLRTEPSRVTVR
jgi:hypothetical protein